MEDAAESGLKKASRKASRTWVRNEDVLRRVVSVSGNGEEADDKGDEPGKCPLNGICLCSVSSVL
jgi:hypothetical protein